MKSATAAASRRTSFQKVVSRHGATHVDLHTNAQISGIVATLGGRLIEGVAKKNVAEFAANLAQLL